MTTAEVSLNDSRSQNRSPQKCPRNGWAAFSEDEEKLVAYGATYDEVVKKAEENGVTEPVLVKVPPTWNDMVL
jgi:Family of unknown function (DUF5678)